MLSVIPKEGLAGWGPANPSFGMTPTSLLLPSNDLCPSNYKTTPMRMNHCRLGHGFFCYAVVKTQKKSCQLTSHLSALTGITSSKAKYAGGGSQYYWLKIKFMPAKYR